jgi:hypothetical protein
LRQAPTPLHISTAPPMPPYSFEVEPRGRVRSLIARSEAEVGGERRRIDDLPGIEDPIGVEGSFDLAKGLVQRRPEHLTHERAAHQAVAVLGGERAAEFEHQIRHVVRNGFELADALFGLHVDHRANVQASD